MPLLPNFIDNHFRAAGCVKHGKENYYLYTWSERIYITKVKDRSHVISCLLVDIELIEDDNEKIVPIVLYERRNPLDYSATKVKEKNMFEPVKFFFEPIDMPSIFDSSKNVQWLNTHRQWYHEFNNLLVTDRSKLKEYRDTDETMCVQTVRDFYGLNRPVFQVMGRFDSFIFKLAFLLKTY